MTCKLVIILCKYRNFEIIFYKKLILVSDLQPNFQILIRIYNKFVKHFSIHPLYLYYKSISRSKKFSQHLINDFNCKCQVSSFYPITYALYTLELETNFYSRVSKFIRSNARATAFTQTAMYVWQLSLIPDETPLLVWCVFCVSIISLHS